MQCAVEMAVEWIDGVVRENYHGKRGVIAPLALTIFVWVFIMNAIDLVPVDYIPQLFALISGDHHIPVRAVPTTDMKYDLRNVYFCIYSNSVLYREI